MIRVCIAGITGWTGRPVANALAIRAMPGRGGLTRGLHQLLG